MGAVFSNLAANGRLLVDPVFWISLLVYTVVFTFSGLLGLKKMPAALVLVILGILLFSYIHTRRCQKVTKHQFIMGTITYVIHRIVFIILSIFPLTRVLRFIPFIGKFIFCLLSLWGGFFTTSMFYLCGDPESKSSS